MAGRPIPPELYRPALSSDVLLALHDRGEERKRGKGGGGGGEGGGGGAAFGGT